jgi:hypothetical protein
VREQIGTQRGDGPESQGTCQRLLEPLCELDQPAALGDHAAGLTHDRLAPPGDGDLPRAALEDRHMKQRLDLADLARECRLRDCTGRGSPAEMTMVGDGHQVFEVPKR